MAYTVLVAANRPARLSIKVPHVLTREMRTLRVSTLTIMACADSVMQMTISSLRSLAV